MAENFTSLLLFGYIAVIYYLHLVGKNMLYIAGKTNCALKLLPAFLL